MNKSFIYLLSLASILCIHACGKDDSQQKGVKGRADKGGPNLLFNNLTVNDTVAVNDTVNLLYTVMNNGFVDAEVSSVLSQSSFCNVVSPKIVEAGKYGTIVGKCAWPAPGNYRGTFHVYYNNSSEKPVVITYDCIVVEKK
jgi:hypothetical protein